MSLLPASLRTRLERWLQRNPDDTVLRWLLGIMLVTTASVLALDFVELNGRAPEQLPAATTAPEVSAEPSPQPREPEVERRTAGRPIDGALKAKMTFDLVGDGRLIAVGTIERGTAEAFAAEIAKRGAYVKTVVLHSPGGSVPDALRMGRLIRQKKFATEVEGGRLCASSCPLVFAGGVERRAGEKAAIGVHQVFAATPPGTTGSKGLDAAQRVSAECQRYLRDMGVDLQVWMHAMETPREELYYFKPDELLALKLATQRGSAKPAAPAPAEPPPAGKSARKS